MSNSTTEMMSTKDAAAYLGVHIQTLLKLCRNQEIEFFKPDGKNFRFRQEALDNYLQKNKEGTSRVVLEGYSCYAINCDQNPYFKYRRGICPDTKCQFRRSLYDEVKYKKLRVIIEEIE